MKLIEDVIDGFIHPTPEVAAALEGVLASIASLIEKSSSVKESKIIILQKFEYLDPKFIPPRKSAQRLHRVTSSLTQSEFKVIGFQVEEKLKDFMMGAKSDKEIHLFASYDMHEGDYTDGMWKHRIFPKVDKKILDAFKSFVEERSITILAP